MSDRIAETTRRELEQLERRIYEAVADFESRTGLKVGCISSFHFLPTDPTNITVTAYVPRSRRVPPPPNPN